MFWEVIKNVGQKHFLWQRFRYVFSGKKVETFLLISLVNARIEVLNTSKTSLF